jgi:hypothetical protein
VSRLEFSTENARAAVVTKNAVQQDPFGVASAVIFAAWLVTTVVVTLYLLPRPDLNREVAACLGWIVEDGANLRVVAACAWLISAVFTAGPGLAVAFIGTRNVPEGGTSKLSTTAMAAHGMTMLPWLAVALGF